MATINIKLNDHKGLADGNTAKVLLQQLSWPTEPVKHLHLYLNPEVRYCDAFFNELFKGILFSGQRLDKLKIVSEVEQDVLVYSMITQCYRHVLTLQSAGA